MPGDDIREEFHHPELTEEEDRLARGGEPTTTRPHPLQPEHAPDEDAEREARRRVEAWLDERPPARRPRQDQLAPSLLVRARVGDHGVRQPPISYFWDSPDVIVVPGDVDSVEGQVATLSPTLGEPQTVFVRVWNLGRLAAIGVRVEAYWANPSFAFNASSPNPPQVIGVTPPIDIADRSSTACMTVVRIPVLWVPTWENEGHECLLARASSLIDRAPAGFDASLDRHVGQLNLHVTRPDADLAPLLRWLGEQLGPRDALQLVHGLDTVTDVLAAHALVGGGEWAGVPHPQPPRRLHVRFDREERNRGMLAWVSSESAGSLLKHFGREGDGERIEPGSAALALLRGLGTEELSGGAIAAALSEDPDDTHLLRLEAIRNGAVIGGYSLVVSQR